MPSSDELRYIVAPVFKTLKILELITGKGHDVSLAMVADELGLPKTSAFRYLRTLAAAGFLEHDAQHDRYGTGPAFRTAARLDARFRALRACAAPVLADLHHKFGETINLAVVSDGHIVYLDVLESRRPHFRARVGSRDPLHSTALGKAILAYLGESERRALLKTSLQERTIRTLTSPASLARQLRDVVRLGAAIERGENEDGVMCIGVPLLDASAHPVAAISLSAPERRMTPSLRDVVVHDLKAAAIAIACELAKAGG